MDIHTNIPLKNYTTMKIGGNARFMTEVRNPDEVAIICKNAKTQNLPIFILGNGSNTIAKDTGFNGIVVRVRIPGFNIIADDINSTTIKIGAGEEWDSVVKRTVDMRLSGIEAMSAIPGTAGATPVQNVGAYGQEISDVLLSVSAYDRQTESFVEINSLDCEFSYRNSVFRDKYAGRYVIMYITIKLSKNVPMPPFFDSLQKYLDERNIKIYTQDVIRNAVIDIRSNKLPNPKNLPNSGSFFKNTIIEGWQVEGLKSIDPNVPIYEMGDNKYKIPTGWLIEQSGLKGQLINGIRVYEKNALVLVNESANSYSDLEAAKNKIIETVNQKFRLQIEQEPIEI